MQFRRRDPEGRRNFWFFYLTDFVVERLSLCTAVLRSLRRGHQTPPLGPARRWRCYAGPECVPACRRHAAIGQGDMQRPAGCLQVAQPAPPTLPAAAAGGGGSHQSCSHRDLLLTHWPGHRTGPTRQHGGCGPSGGSTHRAVSVPLCWQVAALLGTVGKGEAVLVLHSLTDTAWCTRPVMQPCLMGIMELGHPGTSSSVCTRWADLQWQSAPSSAVSLHIC